MSEAGVRDNVSLESLVARVADEFIARQKRGERPDVEEYAARYPEAAALLRKVLAAVEVVGLSLSAAGAAGAGPEGAVTGALGDFRLLREVGRGGMGIVYEAEQVSLGRRVALKVLPFAATLDPRQLQRFQNEARAAAGLHHTHIVPVYAVGCERGVHYYAMQFIEGRTLGDLIAQQRGGPPALPPTVSEAKAVASAPTVPPAAQATSAAPRDAAYFRRAAEWGIQAAEALDCAHSLGVVHRDIKPANLLVDAAGRLWVTDFGLAQVQSDTRLTITGDLVGTLRYMSPEQALARRMVIDHRTDVYSLGATLYELLTLQPVFDGRDREELLRQIALEEPRALRRLDRAIPAELETIVLKALEKNPAERYATAQELADDLERYLRDEPIRARKPSAVQRLRKWGRRHRGAVAAAAAALLAAFAVLAGSIGWVASDLAGRRVKTAAVAEAGQQEVARLQERGRVPEALEAARRLAGLLERDGAEGDLRRRVDTRVADLALLERLENVRLEMTAIKDGRFDYKRADWQYGEAFRAAGLEVEALPAAEAGERLGGTTVAAELAAALDHWAQVRRVLRGREDASWKGLLAVARAADPEGGRQHLRQALEGREVQALADLAASPEVAHLWPATLCVLAEALRGAGRAPQAEALLREAQRQHPDDFWINHDLGMALQDTRPPRWEEAARYFAVAVALRPQSPAARSILGVALHETGDVEGALREHHLALDLDPKFASAHHGLGNALYARGTWTGPSASTTPPSPSTPSSPRPTSTWAGPCTRSRRTWTAPSASTAWHSKSTPSTPRSATTWA
jgi:serine/threonine protein kinase/Flp pilus assembly protein TadD